MARARTTTAVAENAARSATTAAVATPPVRGETNAVKVGRHEVRVSNPDKVFFAERGLTKGDLVRHYLDLADCVLPHVRRWPFHMVLRFA
jgi:hypothetical protein